MSADNKPLYSVETLLQKCVRSVVKNIDVIEDGCMTYLPVNLKDKCLHLLSQRGAVTDENLKQLLQHHVRELCLSQSDITDRALNLLHLCPALTKLDLNSCRDPRTAVTTVGVSYVARHCPQLHTVYLRRCVNISDDAIVNLSCSCPRLQHLNIGGCHHVTDVSLKSLGQNSRHLESVNFSYTSVSDAGVLCLANGVGRQTLKEIQMNGCESLTDESVEAIMQFCLLINILIFHGCPLITEESRIALEQIQDRHHRMKQLTWTVY